jgi:LEA14-like dessication related protein
MHVPKRAGTHAVLVDVYVNGRRVKIARGHSVTQVVLNNLPHGRFTVKLITHYQRGKSATSSQSFVGC